MDPRVHLKWFNFMKLLCASTKYQRPKRSSVVFFDKTIPLYPYLQPSSDGE